VLPPGRQDRDGQLDADGFIGQLFKTIGRHVPPPAGVASPALWGTRAASPSCSRPAPADITAETRQFVFRYRSPAHWIEVFRGYYGPILKAFGALDADGQHALAEDLVGPDEPLRPRWRRRHRGRQRLPRDRHTRR
jgi:hypothetical protein